MAEAMRDCTVLAGFKDCRRFVRRCSTQADTSAARVTQCRFAVYHDRPADVSVQILADRAVCLSLSTMTAVLHGAVHAMYRGDGHVSSLCNPLLNW